jgi:predicted RND superfamily exporter protein
VHLAHAYVQKENCSREDRVREAFEEMGVSVFSGMATSFMGAFVLLFCNLRFFFKFGVFLAATITFSWLFANLVFMSAMATYGPGDNADEIRGSLAGSDGAKDIEMTAAGAGGDVVGEVTNQLSATFEGTGTGQTVM